MNSDPNPQPTPDYSANPNAAAMPPQKPAGKSNGIATLFVVLLVVGIVGFVALALNGVFDPTPKVRVVNGFPKAVTVAFNAQTLAVPAHSVGSIELPAGEYKIVTTFEDGTVVEELSATVKSGTMLQLYNVRGAGDVFVESATFSTNRAPALDAPEETAFFFAGENWVAREDCSYFFEEPPMEIEIYGDQKEVKKWGVYIANQQDKPDWLFALYLVPAETRADAAVAWMQLIPDANFIAEATNALLAINDAAGLNRFAEAVKATTGSPLTLPQGMQGEPGNPGGDTGNDETPPANDGSAAPNNPTDE